MVRDNAAASDVWHQDVHAIRVDDPFGYDGYNRHSHPFHEPHPAVAPGRCCFSAVRVVDDFPAVAPYRSDDERARGRRRSHGGIPPELPALLRAHLNGTEARLPFTPGYVDSIPVHPDIAFALRLAGQPAAV